MEIFLHLLDELDDVAGACRHVARCAAEEAAALSAPLVAGASALGVWLLLPQFRLNAALLAGTATFWGAYRHLLRAF
jgi:hypothetical protein